MKKKTVSGLLLPLLVLSILAFSIQPVKAAGTIYIRPDGTVEGTDKIQRDGVVYTFTDNIYDGIVVEIDNIVIDGADHTLQGTGSGIGLYVEANNVTIRNMKIKAFTWGIYLNSSNNSISGNNITNNGDGIAISGSYNSIFENKLTSNGKGISVYFSYYCNISRNYIAASSYSGIWFNPYDFESHHTSILDNNVTDGYIGIFPTGRDGIFRRNNMVNNTYNFWVDGGERYGYPSGGCFDNDVDASNTVNGKPIYYWVGKHDVTVPLDAGYVALVNCRNITAQNLSLARNGQGILLVNTADSTISENNITKNLHCIYVIESSGNNLQDNDITNSGEMFIYGSSGNSICRNNRTSVELWYSDGNSIHENDLTGITLIETGSNNSIFGNNITAISGFGIYLTTFRYPWGPSNNTIAKNYITNSHGGIWLEGIWGGNKVFGNNLVNCDIGLAAYSWNNTIYHNNFIDNTVQADTPGYGTNRWDDGYPSGGNYWSDHVTLDDYSGANQDEPGSDGIVDEPYVIDDFNRDRYPLVEPWSPVIPATIDIDPDILHLMSTDEWITCYIELPEGYDVSDIDVSTVMLNDTIPVSLLDVPAPDPVPTEIGDYDNDTIPDLMVKFNRTLVSAFILAQRITNGVVTLAITGGVNRTPFEGTDTIRVLMGGGGTGRRK